MSDKINVNLTNDELKRYNRHTSIKEFGERGQQKLKNAKVLIVGAGGLGSPLSLYLAAAGVGTIGIVDFDVVEESNLQRQIIHTTNDVGRLKVESAKERVNAINPYINVIPHNTKITTENAADIIKNFDIVADATDNFQTRYIVNDVCVSLGKPIVYGAVFEFEGQASVFNFNGGPCYRCLCPTPPPPSSKNGVLGVLPGIIGTIQAAEVIKIIVGSGGNNDNKDINDNNDKNAKSLAGRLLIFDAWGMSFRELKLNRDVNCTVCAVHKI